MTIVAQEPGKVRWMGGDDLRPYLPHLAGAGRERDFSGRRCVFRWIIPEMVRHQCLCLAADLAGRRM